MDRPDLDPETWISLPARVGGAVVVVDPADGRDLTDAIHQGAESKAASSKRDTGRTMRP